MTQYVCIEMVKRNPLSRERYERWQKSITSQELRAASSRLSFSVDQREPVNYQELLSKIIFHTNLVFLRDCNQAFQKLIM